MIVNILFIFSIIFLILGLYGVIAKQGIFMQLVSVSLVDTIAFLLLSIALMIKVGLSPMLLKILIIVGFILLTNPIVNHLISRKAYDASQEEMRKEL